MPIVFSDRHRMHDPGGEVWVGVRTDGTELPARGRADPRGARRWGRQDRRGQGPDEEALHAVHDPALVAYLERAWEEWQAAGLTEDPGQDRVVPYVFPHPGMLSGRRPALPTAASARAGYFAYDTMTLVGPGLGAARAALGAAVTAADAVAGGEAAAYACCRPPGHHATRSSFGGSCYLNNAAAAASRLRVALRRDGGRLSTSTPTTATAPRRSSMRIRGSWSARSTSTRARRLVPAFPRLRVRDRRRGGRRREPQPLPGAGLGRPTVAGGDHRARRLGRERGRAGAGGRARGRRRRRRPREPARGQRRRVPGRGRGAGQPRAAHRRRPGGRL